MKAHRLIWVIGLITGSAIAGLVALWVWAAPLEDRFGSRSFDRTYEFLLVVVVGGALSLVYKEFDRDRARRIQERELHRDFYRSLVVAYGEVKRIRRLLRAKALHSVSTEVEAGLVVARGAYDEYMQLLNVVQLDVELLVRQVESEPDFYDSSGALKSSLKRMKSYLREVVREYGPPVWVARPLFMSVV